MRVKAANLESGNVIIRGLIQLDWCFTDQLPAWQQQYFVTYESLPIEQARFERLDKRRQNPG